jgi:hypothetical protein
MRRAGLPSVEGAQLQIAEHLDGEDLTLQLIPIGRILVQSSSFQKQTGPGSAPPSPDRLVDDGRRLRCDEQIVFVDLPCSRGHEVAHKRGFFCPGVVAVTGVGGRGEVEPDPRLMYSWELIAKPEGSSLTDVKLWRLEQPLPTSMGGADIGGSERNCDACFASSMLACAPRLAGLPGYAGVDLTMLDHGMFAAARTGYDATVEDHHRVSRMLRGCMPNSISNRTTRFAAARSLAFIGRASCRVRFRPSRTCWNLRVI